MKTDSATQAIWFYHQVTKHRLDAYAPGPGFLDWDSQPDPFRHWAGCVSHPLPPGNAAGRCSYRDMVEGTATVHALGRHGIGRFLELALGLSGWKSIGPDRWALRNNPSSGNLHPTEGYLLLWRAVDGLAPGLHHYSPYHHALACRAVLPQDVAADIDSTLGGTSFGALGLSSVTWREEWKYGARAFRSRQLDAGHALGAAAYAAATLGWRTRLAARCDDRQLARMLGVDRAGDFIDAEDEQPEMLIMLGDQPVAEPDWQILADALSGWQGRASRLSRERVSWPQVRQAVEATRRDDRNGNPAAVTACSNPSSSLEWAGKLPDTDVEQLIRRRRSAQRMDGQTSMALEDFQRTLQRTLPVTGRPVTDAWPYRPMIHLVLMVHRVDGIEPGLYCLLRDADALDDLRMATSSAGFEWAAVDLPGLSLYRLRAAEDVSRLASRVSCHQAIAGHGAFAVSMLGELGNAIETEGAWAWRRLHWEAGLVGQILYLEAEASCLQGTGIGCFFDDEVHDLLGLAVGARPRWQVLYHFTVGRAIVDRRLQSEPPYGHLERFAPGSSRGREPGDG
jgi:SagB-type dehydrogenase family enzyme